MADRHQHADPEHPAVLNLAHANQCRSVRHSFFPTRHERQTRRGFCRGYRLRDSRAVPIRLIDGG